MGVEDDPVPRPRLGTELGDVEDEGDGQSGERDPGEAVPGAGEDHRSSVRHAATSGTSIAVAGVSAAPAEAHMRHAATKRGRDGARPWRRISMLAIMRPAV